MLTLFEAPHQSEKGAMQPQVPLVVDLTAIAPSVSGGVSLVAAGVVSGLSHHGGRPRCLVAPGTAAEWNLQFSSSNVSIEEIKIPLRANSLWQVTIRRILPESLKRSWVVRLVRSARSRPIAAISGDVTTWFPFHRSVARARTAVVTVHDLRVFEADFASPMDQQIISDNVSAASAIVCSWAHPYEHLVELFPEAATKTFLVPLPVLNPGLSTARPAPDGSEVRILYPAHVTPHKNHEVILRAMATRPNFWLTCTGSEVPSHAAYLKKLAQRLGVASRITWRGFVSTEELEAEYRHAHVLAMPTRWEAASGPMFEAIVRGLPFVSSNIGPLTAQLRSLNLVMPLFAWDNPAEFAEAVDAIVNDYAMFRERLATPGTTLRSRSWPDTAAEYAQVFSWVAGKGAKPRQLQITAKGR